jgi:hypothetical protein
VGASLAPTSRRVCVRRAAPCGRALTVVVALAAADAAADPPRVVMTLEAAEPISAAAADPLRRLVTKPDDRVRLGQLVRRDRKLTVELAGAAPVALPRDLDTQVSADGSTIVQSGDEAKLDLPRRTDVYWYDAKGVALGRLVGRYAGNAVVALSTDGFTAVGGQVLDEPGETALGLYTPQGSRLWEVRLAPSERVATAAVAPGGRFVVTLVTDATRWLEGHRLRVHREGGTADAPVAALGVVQKLVLLGDGQRAFVQGLEAFGVLDAATNRLSWRREGRIRMVSPHGAALDAEGRIIFLMLARLGEKARDARQKEYRWNLRALDAASGQDAGSLELPTPHPATWGRVFEEVTASQIRILAGSSRVTLGWRQGGDR